MLQLLMTLGAIVALLLLPWLLLSPGAPGSGSAARAAAEAATLLH
jgi:hypothetical protein